MVSYENYVYTLIIYIQHCLIYSCYFQSLFGKYCSPILHEVNRNYDDLDIVCLFTGRTR